MLYFGLFPVCLIWDAHMWIASCKGFLVDHLSSQGEQKREKLSR